MLSAAVPIVKTGNSYGCEVATITLKNGELTLSRLDLVVVVIRSAVFTRATTQTTTTSSNIPNVNLADKRDKCTIPSFSVGQRNQIRHF